MEKPIIVILSRDTHIADEIRDRLADTVEFACGETFLEVRELAAGRDAFALIADFRMVQSGGHGEAELLERLRNQCPQLPIAVLTRSECPEPLERLAACSQMLHMRGSVDFDSLALWLMEGSMLAAEAPSADAADVSDDQDAAHMAQNDNGETVLNGITRRFETRTPQLKEMLADLEVAARHDVTILLIGETGSGKTFLSSLIHEVSPRRDEPFLPVACGALPAELIESELFGHVKGAFTSAHADKEGKFIAAGRGTILLDEIDVLGPEQQVKLLRVIETGEFEAVGSNKTLKSQARLVVASNLDLQPLVEQGKFRPDLYYRLNMLKFEIPPLRARKPDVGQLAKKFVEQLAKKHNVEIREIRDDLYDALYSYPWPGNVRELENVIQRAVIYCRDGILSAKQLPPHIVMGHVGPTNDPSVKLKSNKRETTDLGGQIALTEQDIIEQALFRNNYSRTNTARDLGISRVTLYNKMKKYGMSK